MTDIATTVRWIPELGGYGWAGVALAVALAALAGWLYHRQLRHAPLVRRVSLPTLRALAVMLVALMLAEPAFQWRRSSEQRGRVTFLIDHSGSMGVPDHQMPAGRKLLIAQSLGIADLAGIDLTLAHLSEQLCDADIHDLDRFAEVSAALASLDPEQAVGVEPSGYALLEYWDEVPGHELREFARRDVLSSPPTETRRVTSLRLPQDVDDNFAMRITGRLRPPVDGGYTFALAADATAELCLEIDGEMRSIVSVDQKTVPNDFTTNLSTPLPLTAGDFYRFELLHKDGTGSDHLTLAWSRDGEPPVVIAGGALAPPAPQATPADRRDALVRAFNEEVVNAARAVATIEDDAAHTEASTALAANVAAWADRLDSLFDAYAKRLIEKKVPAAVNAAAAFDALTRTQRIVSHIDGGLAAETEAQAELVRTEIGSPTTTDLAAALTEIMPLVDSPQAVVLFSDGRQTAGNAAALADAAAALDRAEIPVYSVLIGADVPPLDLAVAAVNGPEIVHHEDHATGQVVLIDAMPPGREFELQAVIGDKSVWQQTLTTTGEGRRTVDFDFAIDESLTSDASAGRNELLLPVRFHVRPIEGELREDNNTTNHALRVVMRSGKVLIIDGRPRWDSRYIAATLGRDNRFDAVEVLRLTDDGRVPTGPEAFPADGERLREFNAIIFGEVPAAAWPDEQLEWLHKFVTEHGGGIVFLDGLRGRLAEYADTPLGALLPVTRGTGSAVQATGIRLTDAGRSTPALRLEGEAQQNADAWSTLPAPRWAYDAAVKPGVGEVLTEVEVGGELPARPGIVRAQVGRGRAWYVGFDETWRWRKGAENRRQSRFWNGVINAVVEPPFAAEDAVAAIGVEDASVPAGGTVQVRARLKADDGRTLDGEALAGQRVTARLSLDGRIVASAPLAPDAAGGGLLRGTIEAPDEPGLYEVSVVTDALSESEQTAAASVLVTALQPSTELARLDADADAMRLIADRSGGVFYREEDAGALASHFEGFTTRTERSGRYELWTSWPLFTTAVGLLSMEWFLRRRMGMM